MKEKKYLMVHDYTVDKALDKIKRMRIEKRDDIKALIDTDNKLRANVTSKTAVKIMACVVKYCDKFYPQLFLEETLYHE